MELKVTKRVYIFLFLHKSNYLFSFESAILMLEIHPLVNVDFNLSTWKRIPPILIIALVFQSIYPLPLPAIPRLLSISTMADKLKILQWNVLKEGGVKDKCNVLYHRDAEVTFLYHLFLQVLVLWCVYLALKRGWCVGIKLIRLSLLADTHGMAGPQYRAEDCNKLWYCWNKCNKLWYC